MDDIKFFVSARDLLQDLPRDNCELSQFKEKDLLQIVERKFFTITGFHCAPRKFRSTVKKIC